MALIKLKTLDSGASGDYWKITTVLLNRDKKEISLHISLFKDAAHSSDNKPSLFAKWFTAAIDQPAMDGNLVELGYQIIKSQAATLISQNIHGDPVTPYYRDQDLFNAVDG